jgi:hypothetical protein
VTAVGYHVHELSAPTVDLVVEAVAELRDGHELLRAVDPTDPAREPHYVAAADTEPHARHRRPLDVVLPPLPGDPTERGVLADVHMGNPWFGGLR